MTKNRDPAQGPLSCSHSLASSPAPARVLAPQSLSSQISMTSVTAFPAHRHHTSKPSPGAGIDKALKAREDSQGPDFSTFIKDRVHVHVCTRVCVHERVGARSSASVCEEVGYICRQGLPQPQPSPEKQSTVSSHLTGLQPPIAQAFLATTIFSQH